jgi:TonB-dependent receptor
MKKSVLIFQILFAFTLLISSGFSQGTLTGIISDSLTNEALIAAEVYFIGTAIGAVADINGEYRIDGIPAGTYNLRVSYIGYHQKNISINIKAAQTVNLNVKLAAGTVEGEVIQITAQAMGQTAAINQQVKSKTIVNVVSEERIKELPDANAAEAVGRLPGVALQRSGGEASMVVLRGMDPRYTSISLDGVRIADTGTEARQVDLSTISQRSLAGIELYKALTSDMDADAIAGGLNLVTKDAPAIRTITADFRGSYNQMEKSYSQYDFAGKYGERFFNNKLGVQISANLERRIRSQENLDAGYEDLWLTQKTYYVADLELNYRDEIRKREGISALFDFDTPDGGSIKWNTIYSRTNRNYLTNSRNYPVHDDLFYIARDRNQDIATINSFIKGNNYLYGLTVDWNFSYAQSRTNTPFDFELDFQEPSTAVQGHPDSILSKMRNPSTAALKGSPEGLIPYACNNFDAATLYSAYYRTHKSQEKDLSGSLNLLKKYTLSNLISGELKIGGKYREKTRSRKQTEKLCPYYIIPYPEQMMLADGTLVDKELAGTWFEDLKLTAGLVTMRNFLESTPKERDVFDKYRLYPLIKKEVVQQWWDINKKGYLPGSLGAEYQFNQEVEATFYDVDERVSAAYLMNTFNFGSSISLIAGIRVEHENNEYQSKYTPEELFSWPAPHGILKDTSAVHHETEWLPNFHLTIRPTSFLSVRLAAYEALARPDFNRRLESFTARQTGFLYSGYTLTIGNSRLKAAKAWNFEVNTSLYESKYGLFSVSAFYKDIKDMFHLIDNLPFSPSFPLDSIGIGYENPFTGRDYNLIYPYNSSKPTRVWGFEFEIQTYLRYLPGFLKNFVINGNCSIVRSETYIPSVYSEKYLVWIPGFPYPLEYSRFVLTEKKQKLEGQPEFFGNLALGYDIGGFSVRLSVFHQGEYNIDFSPRRTSDGVRESYTRLDLILKQELTKNIGVFVNINNLTNTREGTAVLNRLSGSRYINEQESYGITGDIGLRLTF